MKTLFLTGWGLLAQALAHVATDNGWEVHAVSRRTGAGCGVPLDLVDRASPLRGIVHEAQPDVIVHTAARTNVADCQRNPVAAFRDNVIATQHVLDAANEDEIPVIFLSTDAVFDGTRGHYHEDDRRGPVNIYALTKAHAEDLVVCREGLVIRGTFIGRRPDGVPGLVERLLDRSARPTVPEGKRASPLWVGHAMAVLLELVASQARGFVHIGSSDATGWAELAARVRGSSVEETSSSDDVPRPRDTSLDVSRAVALTGHAMPTVAHTVASMLRSPALTGAASA